VAPPASGGTTSGPPAAAGGWLVRASTSWHGEDRGAVAAALARGLRHDDRVRDERAEVDGLAFTVSFATRAASAVEAHEIASDAVRRAWRAVGVDAVVGRDYDASFIEVRPA
jgi:hypothetical protein